MKRKNLFLIPALFLISTLCLINVSCFSGFQEKGEVTVTFSESTLRQIMARGADISEEQEDFDFDPTANMYAYYAGMTSNAQETFALYVYQDATYVVYAVSKMEAIAKDLQERYGNLTEEDYLSNPEILEMLKNPMALYEKAIISKGSWSQSGDSISITEKKYMDLSTEQLIDVQNPEVIATISMDTAMFSVTSKSGYTITFYKVSDYTDIDDPYEEEPVDSAKLSVKLVAGNMSYEKTFTVYSNTKKAHVEFTDIPVGVTAKVFATVYLDEPHGGQITFAKGESEEFVIQSGPNYAKIKLREYNGEDEPDELIPPSGTPTACYIGECSDDENVNEYILAFYENNQYAVWELPEGTITNKEDEEISIDVLQYGTIVSFGKYSLSITDDDLYQSYEYRYSETAYYDKDLETYRASQYGGSGSGAMPCEINFTSLSGLKVRFTIGGSNSQEEFVPPSGSILTFLPGTSAENPDTVNYILALYDSNEYSIYEFSDEFIENAGEKYGFSGDTTTEERNAIMSEMLKEGTVIAFGSYSFSIDENERSIFNYVEKAYRDQDSGKFIASTFSGSCDPSVSFYMQLGDATGRVIMFGSYESGHENKQIYSGQTLLPEDFREQFNGGWLYFSVLSDGTYSIYANIYGEDAQYMGNKYFAKGTWQSLEAEGSSPSLQLIETEYYDFDSDGLVSGGNKETIVELSKTSFSYNSSTGIELEFTLNVEDVSYPFTFIIKGFDKNDVTDLDGNECNVTLYAITDQTDMQFIKSTLESDELTDDEKAEVLVPIVERSQNYSITAFQPGVNYSSHEGAPTSEVLDDGTIKWSGTCYTPLSEGTIYGVLATVYFSQNYSSGYYEFDIGCADGLSLSSESNEVELTVSAMDIPCKIHFYHDGDYDSQYTVTTAMSEIMMFDEDDNIRESVLNELWAAAEASVNALAEKNYEYDSNSKPDCGLQDGVPFVTLYYVEKKSLQFAITLNDVPQKDGVDSTWYIIYAVNDDEMLSTLRTHFAPGSISYEQIDTINAQLGLNETVINYSASSNPDFEGYSILSDGTVKFSGIKPELSYEDGDTGNFLAIVYTVTGSVRTFVSAGFLEDISLSIDNVNELNFNMLTPLDVSASGNIVTDSRSVVIFMNYDADALYLNQGTFEFSAKYPNGANLSESDAEEISWSAQLLYKGKNVNNYGDPYYELSGNKLLLQKQIPLPSAGAYQIYVTAIMPLNEYGSRVTSGQTFNVTIPDRHIYDISDDEQPWQYATSLHNVVINGDVTEDDWDWTLSDEGYDHLLQVLFAKHKSTLESLTFNDAFTSPAYTQTAESPLYDSNSYSGIQFGRHVSLLFNDVATIGDYLFGSARNIETVKFTTVGSSVGDCCFRDASTLTTLDLTGVTTIGSYAFSAANLKEITIPESVTEINEGAFVNCYELESAVFEITEGWKYIMNGDTEVANVSSDALSLFNDFNITKLFRE